MLESMLIKELEEYGLKPRDFITENKLLMMTINSKSTVKIKIILDNFFSGYDVDIRITLSKTTCFVKIFHSIVYFIRNDCEFPLSKSYIHSNKLPKGHKFSVILACKVCGSFKRIKYDYGTDCYGCTESGYDTKTKASTYINQHNRKVTSQRNKLWTIPIVHGDRHTFKPS